MNSDKNIFLRSLGMPVVSSDIKVIVEYLFARWEKELKGDKLYLLMMSTPLSSSGIELLPDDKDALSELAVKLTGGHQSCVGQRGYFSYYPKDTDFDVFVSAEYSGLVEYKLKLPIKEMDVEYLREKVGKFLQLCSSWYTLKGFNEDILFAVMITQVQEAKLVEKASAYSQVIPEPFVFSYHLIPWNKLTDLNVKMRIMRELKGAFNIE